MSSLPTSPAQPAPKPTAPAPPRRMHPVDKKRRIVEETFRPHASVARIAQAHGVNANQVFYTPGKDQCQIVTQALYFIESMNFTLGS